MTDPIPLVAVKPLASISIVMMPDGQVTVLVESKDMLAVFNALGTAVGQLAAEYGKQRDARIQLAPASLLQQLPHN